MTLETIEAGIREILGRRGNARFALLFGSLLIRGPYQAGDVDVAVAFARPVSLLELAGLAGEIEDALGRDVDVIDLNAANTLLRWEVLRTGRVVVAADPEALADFRAHLPLEYFDLEPHLERQGAGLRRAVLGAGWSASTS